MTNEPFTIEQFYKFLGQQKLMAGRCIKCGKIHLPPRNLCDNCLGKEFDWVEISGEGKLVTYTVIHVAPHQFQGQAPYAVGIVRLGKGLRVPGMINGIPHEKLEIGIPLRLDFGSCSATQAWPRWQRYCFKPL